MKKLILSDKPLALPEIEHDDSIEFVDLSKRTIANCMGCFGCWVKTPGKCVIRDDAVKIYPRIAESDHVLYISKVKYGSYDTIMKTMLERAIPIQQAFIRLLDGQTHHVQRDVALKEATIIGYGDISEEEQNIFRQLVHCNAKNMNFAHHRVFFASEENLEQAIREVLFSWER